MIYFVLLLGMIVSFFIGYVKGLWFYPTCIRAIAKYKKNGNEAKANEIEVKMLRFLRAQSLK